LKYSYLNAILQPESGAYAIEEWGYGHSNKKAFEIADQTIIEELGWTHPEALVDDGVLLEPFDPIVQQKLNLIFAEVQAGF